jgi:hypothetical protein
MKIVVIRNRPDGKSSFCDEELMLADKGRFGRFSDLQEAPGVLFREMDADYDSGWHCVPHPLYLVILAGEIEIEAGSGEVRRFGAGAILRPEDDNGEGHRTRGVGGRIISTVVVNLTPARAAGAVAKSPPNPHDDATR